MCGRIAQFTPSARLARYFEAQLDDDLDPDERAGWNVGPTRDIAGVAEVPASGPGTDPARLLGRYRWGLIPKESKRPSSASRLFNARAESVSTRPSFKEAFSQRRVIVPVDGFFEWRKQGRRRQPHYFYRTDHTPLAIAGLWDEWEPRRPGIGLPNAVRSCTIITTRAGQDMDGVHDRMPVVLDPSTFDIWLEGDETDLTELKALLRPPPQGTLDHYRVDPRVGNVRHDDPGLIERFAAASRQQTLL